ncbi:MAG: ferritin-like domain-containing protein [Trueperaceae bacterium]
MDYHATEPMIEHRERNREAGTGSNLTGMVRRRPLRTVLMGTGIALAVGMFLARRRSRAGTDDQYGWAGGEAGMAYRGGTKDAKKRTLLAWLTDAHAMEKAVAQSLRHHAHNAKEHPVMQARLERHLEETRHHAELVRECIERLGGRVSMLKSGMSTVMGTVQGVATTPAKDELVKNILADSAAERLEIASYQGIITAADEIGDSETARVCRQILREEEAMSEWLEQQLPSAVRDQMAHA